MIDTRKTGYAIFFQAPPPLGTTVTYWGGHTAELVSVSDYAKADGQIVPLLEWRFNDGRVGTSGLRGKTVYWRSAAEAKSIRA